MPELRARSRTPSTSRAAPSSPEKSSPRKGVSESKGCCFSWNFCSKWSASRQQQCCTISIFVFAILIVAGAICTVHHRCTYKVNANTVGERIAYALRILLLAGATLAGSIKYVVYKRLFTSAINPLSGNERIVDVPNRILQNTLEQVVLHGATILPLATYLNADQLKFIPLLTGIFFLGRVLFFWGYPNKRTFGFALTYVPTGVAFWANIYFIYTRGLAAF